MADLETPIPPSEWPKVAIPGVGTYEVRYGMTANYQLSKQGISPADALGVLTENNAPQNFARILDIWGACVAHHFTLAKPKLEPPTGEQWAATLDGQDTGIFTEIANAVRTAILKWSLERKAKAAPTPAKEMEAAAPPTPIN